MQPVVEDVAGVGQVTQAIHTTPRAADKHEDKQRNGQERHRVGSVPADERTPGWLCRAGGPTQLTRRVNLHRASARGQRWSSMPSTTRWSRERAVTTAYDYEARIR